MEQTEAPALFRPGAILALDERLVRALAARPGHAQELFAAYGSRSSGAGVAGPRNVAVIPIFGLTDQWAGWWGTGTEDLQASLRAAVANRDVGSILLLVNSPGGTVYGCEETAAAVRSAAAVKPTVAMVSSLAASAAFFIISGSSEIVIGPSAEAGSIGVFGVHVDESRALDAQGMTVTVVSAGEHKVDGMPFAPLSDPARAEMEGSVNRYYTAFVNTVALGRRVPPGVVRSRWQARVYGAAASVDLGLADRVGTIDVALARASALADRSAASARASRLDAEVRARMTLRARATGRGLPSMRAVDGYVEDKIRARERL
jgi:capsid assembly protease